MIMIKSIMGPTINKGSWMGWIFIKAEKYSDNVWREFLNQMNLIKLCSTYIYRICINWTVTEWLMTLHEEI